MRLVYGTPTPKAAAINSNNGISQVILNLEKTLPKHGFKLVNEPKNARLTAHHAGDGLGQTDIAFCHGLYPTGMPEFTHGKVHGEINRRVGLDVVGAKEVIVPSEWVGQIIRKEFGVIPHVVNWGVNLEQWQTDEKHGGYVLWNKNRIEGVCSPAPMNRLAAMAPSINFVSTFGNGAGNVNIIGQRPFEEMRDIIKNAMVYLATTPETGDIGSREALAAGVPVLGFKHGALPDFVQHGVNGFLAELGDWNGLLRGLEFCIAHRATLSANAKKMAKKYKWTMVATKVAKVFDLALKAPPTVRVSIVIPCYNYQDFIGKAIESAINQETELNYEIIVVDDGSTDDSLKVINQYRGITVVSQQNQGVGYARHNGIQKSRGEYIICLDADDTMEPQFLQVCYEAMERDRTLGIAYTGMRLVQDGRISGWPTRFDMDKHLYKRINQVPTCNMFRRRAYDRTLGYQEKFHPAEDARLWTDILETGYRAEKVTEAALFNYNIHNDSATRDGAGRVKDIPLYTAGKGWIESGDAPVAMGGGIKNSDPPLVSFIVPVGQGHDQYLRDALDSIKGQSIKDWEILVINDTGDDIVTPAWVRLYKTKKRGASVARNIGLQHARGRFITFLDADDMLCPTFIEETYNAYKTHGGYVFTDCYTKKEGIKPVISRSFDFEPGRIFEHGFQNFITTLIPAKEAKKYTFDETMKTWEDLDYYMQLVRGGCCGKRVHKPLFVYRLHTGNLRELGATWQEDIKAFLGERYHDYIFGGKEVACKCQQRSPAPIEGERVRIEYNPQNRKGGITAGRHTIKGSATGQNYGRREKGDVFMMFKDDVVPNIDIFVPITDIIEEPPQTVIPEKVKVV